MNGILDREEADPVFSLALGALIAEYNAIREANLSRDQMLGSFTNFMMVVFSATIAGLSVIISQQQYLLLPILSLLLSAIGLSYRRQAWLLNELVDYESEVLRSKLQILLRKASYSEEIPEGANDLWQWQLYREQRERSGSMSHRLARRLAQGDMGYFSVVGSAGYLLLFFHYREISGLLLWEVVLVLLAGAFSVWLLLAYTHAAISRLKSLAGEQNFPLKAIGADDLAKSQESSNLPMKPSS